MNRFWKWQNRAATDTEPAQRDLFLNGVIAEESWFGDDVTPEAFRTDLMAERGDVSLWINSPGGDVFAAAQMYNMLRDYKAQGFGDITVKIDGLAASAATVVAMAGTQVLASPVSMFMIHNPSSMAWGDTREMQKVIDVLGEVKESIINAYEGKTGLSRARLSDMMDAETWLSAKKAVELGFADGILFDRAEPDNDGGLSLFSSRLRVTNSLVQKIAAAFPPEEPQPEEEPTAPTNVGRSVDALMDRLDAIKDYVC